MVQRGRAERQGGVVFELVGVGFGVGEGLFELVGVGVGGFGFGLLLAVEGEAGGELAAGAGGGEVEGRWGWRWVGWRCGGYVEGWVAGEVLHAVLSAWLLVGKIATDGEEGDRVYFICGVTRGRRNSCGDVRCCVLESVMGTREWQEHDERGEAWHICVAVWLHRLVKRPSSPSNAICHYRCVGSTTLSRCSC